MALVPGVGFLVKQSLAIWALFYCGHLALFDHPRSSRRLITFALVAFGGIAVVATGCYLLWGDPFIYWTVIVPGSSRVSLLRSFQHMLDAWAYWVVGLLGGLVLLRTKGLQFL